VELSMRLARRDAIYDALKRHGQGPKEVNKKWYHPKGVDKKHTTAQTKTPSSLFSRAGSCPLIRSTLEVISNHDTSPTLRWRPRPPRERRSSFKAGVGRGRHLTRKKRRSYGSLSVSREFIRTWSRVYNCNRVRRGGFLCFAPCQRWRRYLSDHRFRR